jgi:hypothetical protein
VVTVASLSLAAHGAAATWVLWPRKAETVETKGDPAPSLAGETFELPAPDTDEPLAQAAPAPEMTAPSDVDFDDAPARPVPPKSKARPSARASHEGRPSGGKSEGTKDGMTGGSGSQPGTYGAVGDRSAQDLRSAFLRAFALTASANPAWAKAPIGSLGEVTINITLDESGHITDYKIGGSPSALLRSGLESTMQLVKNRPFTSQGKTTKLHFAASITEGGGGVFGVDASGSFTLPVGHAVSLTPLR